MKINIDERNVYFCSDPHYHHKTIIKHLSNWSDTSKCRVFSSLEEHDNTLVNNINDTVGKNDILFCMGDWSFGKFSESTKWAREFRDRLNVKELHLILGNHDKYILRNKDNIQSIFTSVNERLEIDIIEPSRKEGVKAYHNQVVLSHYAMRTWNKSHRGSYMLYGHSHGSLDEINYRTMDVGFDTHPEFRPYSWAEIKDILAKKQSYTDLDKHRTPN